MLPRNSRNTPLLRGFAIRVFPMGLFLALACFCLSAPAQSFDATAVQDPTDIGTKGLVQIGDDPAYARPDFDDSKWVPVDAKSMLKDYFPGRQSPILWRRIHIKVAPNQTSLAVQAWSISRAFEVYINGRKVVESGQIEPFVPYTRNVRHIVRLSAADLQSGTVVIAIRARAPRTWWTSIGAGFFPAMVSLGPESALHDKATLGTIGGYTPGILEDLLGFGVGLVALALFTAQRSQFEYLWIFVMGLQSALIIPLLVINGLRDVPVTWTTGSGLLGLGINICILLLVQAFRRKRFGRIFWLASLGSLILDASASLAYGLGSLPYIPTMVCALPIWIIFGGILPFFLLKELRCGNREAGMLLIPIFFYCAAFYYVYTSVILQLIPASRSVGAHLYALSGGFSLGGFYIGLADLGTTSFWLSMAIIMVFRSTRMSRQQALLENELLAAREVQQIILPEQMEPVPGFNVESVYQPAQQVGGDFFQVLPDSRDGLLLVVGDVAGKGLPAAMLVSVLVGTIRTAAAYSQAPAEVLAQLNERLVGRSRGGFATALAAHITADGWVTIANAGHLSPYLDGKEIELPGALPLGVVAAVDYETTSFHLPHGSRLTFYSDGVVEAQNEKGELFGFERAKAMSTEPAADIAEAARRFGQSDDITVVAIERDAALATAA